MGTPNNIRVKRQDEPANKKEESFETELCKDKDAGEWFRLVAGEGDNCRDVIQCTSSVSSIDSRAYLFSYLFFSFLANIQKITLLQFYSLFHELRRTSSHSQSRFQLL